MKLITFIFFFQLVSIQAGLVKSDGKGNLLISGNIDLDNQKTILKEIQNTKKVILNDVGSGEVDVYLPIANKIFERKIETEIQNACIATCAYLFLAGSKKTFNAGFLGITEGTFYYVENWEKVKNQFENPDKSAKKEDLLKLLKRLSEMELNFLTKAKVDKKLFYRYVELNQSRGDNSYSFYIIRPTTLEKYGVKTQGTMKEVSVLFDSDMKTNKNLYTVE